MFGKICVYLLWLCTLFGFRSFMLFLNGLIYRRIVCFTKLTDFVFLNQQEDDFKRTMEESAKLQRAYDKYFDKVIINNDLDDTYNQIMDAIERLAMEPQWVPVTWVY